MAGVFGLIGCISLSLSLALPTFFNNNNNNNNNKNICANVVIFTDSLSSVFLFMDRSPSTYLFIVYDMHEIIHNLLSDICVRIQYVPGHKGITGNEVADGAAKEALDNIELERARVAREEMVRISSIGLRDRWQSEWTNR